jgi:hypothetical protein
MTKLFRKTRLIFVLFAVLLIFLYTHSQQIKQRDPQVELRQIANFTFTVPVELMNLHPDIIEGMVLINVKKKAGGRDLIASVEKKFQIVNGSFKKDLVLAFSASPGQRPDLARFWDATLFLRTKDSDQFRHALSLTANPPYEADRSKPFSINDYGDIKLGK